MNTTKKMTVHLVGNAHIDPVWLWRYSAGVGEAIATCNTAAGLLDRYREFVFTRADSWVYEQIERFDPVLFERVGAFVRESRWDVSGGWYIQPDCNFPTEDGFLAHMRIGREYFRRRFHTEVTTAMNVDSFGHTAFLPRFLKESGFESYVFMRPGKQERELPAELFRWVSPDGFEILTWRIQRSYNAADPDELQQNIEASLEAAVPGIPHVLCFYGVGDHGGGPTAALIEWIMENKALNPDVDLVFSSPARFFDAVGNHHSAIRELPEVTGELQYHAIGCYSVLGSFKRSLRQAEYRVIEAKGHNPDAADEIDEIWKPVLLNQFHDTAGGTCIPEAYRDAVEQLGGSATSAERVIADACYRHLVGLPPNNHQRVVLFNSTDTAFRGPVSHEPWLEWEAFHGTLRDSKGSAVPYQLSRQPALFREKRLMTWIAAIPPNSAAEYFLDPSPDRITETENDHWTIHAGVSAPELLNFEPSGESSMKSSLELIVLEDSSDTWSHDISSYDERLRGRFEVQNRELEEDGPVRSSIRLETSFGASRATMAIREYSNHPGLELEIRITWNERFSIAKLVFTLPEELRERIDGVPGGSISRPRDGTEYPVSDWVRAAGADGRSLAILTPDCFSCDFRGREIRLTLLRAAPFAWHYPHKLTPDYPYRFTDQGEHIFKFVVLEGMEPDTIDKQARFLHLPPRVFDWTRGMDSKRQSR